jgi:two-component system OmpR family sensor kinase
LRAMVQSVCADLQAKHPNRSVEWRIADDLPVVQADATLLRQVLALVLDNAVKFSAMRTPAVIAVERDGDAIVVRDNGVGFNPAAQSKLFHVFGRLHSQRDFEGIGMGLALTRKIVQRHGGTVSAEGVVDGGCCVRITLPH